MATLTPEMMDQLRVEMANMIQQGFLAAQAQAAQAAASAQRGSNPFSEDESGNRGYQPAARDRRDGGGNSHYLSPKHSRLDSFQGDANAWTLWSFGFKRLARSQNKALYKELVRAEGLSDEYQEDTDLPTDLESLSGQLYDMLCNCLFGEPLGLISAVDYEGVRAWQHLHRKYSPRTMARGVRLLSEAPRPRRSKT